ncbi:hypothetical protein ACFWGI_35540 [Streptomyces niveus]|uniref:hypothetical protein n=1 Tax=Streptomyces niveus TaxID=193462 RepID=UPI003663BE0A
MPIDMSPIRHEAAAWADLGLPDLRQLTPDVGKRERYQDDPLLAEGWASLLRIAGEQGAYDFAQRSALLWLRPDVFAAGREDLVLRRVSGIRAAGCRSRSMSAVAASRRRIRRRALRVSAVGRAAVAAPVGGVP